MWGELIQLRGADCSAWEPRGCRSAVGQRDPALHCWDGAGGGGKVTTNDEGPAGPRCADPVPHLRPFVGSGLAGWEALCPAQSLQHEGPRAPRPAVWVGLMMPYFGVMSCLESASRGVDVPTGDVTPREGFIQLDLVPEVGSGKALQVPLSTWKGCVPVKSSRGLLEADLRPTGLRRGLSIRISVET